MFPLAGHGLMDNRTRAAETRHAAITPGSLVAHGHELFKNSYVVEGLSLPGTFADGQYSLEIEAVAHRPRLLDTTRQYLETGVSATDSAQQAKSLGKSHQFGGTGTVTQSATTPVAPTNTGTETGGSDSAGKSTSKPNKNQLNPAVRLNKVSRTDTSDTLSAGTGVNRTPTESGALHRVVADVTYVVTVRAGSRTLLNGVGNPGTIDPITFSVDVPDGLQFLMTQGQLNRDARWMGSVNGLTPTPVPGQAPLPAAYVRNRQLGLGGVLSVIEYDRPVAAPVPATGPAAGQVPLGPVNPRSGAARSGASCWDWSRPRHRECSPRGTPATSPVCTAGSPSSPRPRDCAHCQGAARTAPRTRPPPASTSATTATAASDWSRSPCGRCPDGPRTWPESGAHPPRARVSNSGSRTPRRAAPPPVPRSGRHSSRSRRPSATSVRTRVPIP
ncbi:hypothetical protein N7U49_35660 [Streptomyces sp. AD2-2]|nr:hypothetical protein N7U49_35660 [Streptomyces sp. AD2-2]